MLYTLLKHRSTAPLWITLTVFTAVMTVALDGRSTIAQTVGTESQQTEQISLEIESNRLIEGV